MPRNERIEDKLKSLPASPGVYLMKDDAGRVLYVGKAQSLRHRVRQYWQASRSAAPLRIESAIDQVVDVEYTMTDTVSEALLLEANLIKRYQPRFNVRLKDDKSYPFIKVTLADDFPRIERTRKLPNDGSRYFGPYASASSVDESMNLIRRIFPFRTCTIEIREGEQWKEIQRQTVNDIGWSALFRVDHWDTSRDIPYRIRHGRKASWEGLIRKDPVDKEEIGSLRMKLTITVPKETVEEIL